MAKTKDQVGRPATRRQMEASKRNFQLFRLSGFTLDTNWLTREELAIWKKAKEQLDRLRKKWDKGSEELGFHVRTKKY